MGWVRRGRFGKIAIAHRNKNNFTISLKHSGRLILIVAYILLVCYW